MNAVEAIEALMRLVLMLAGLLIPGSMLLRALRVPWSPAMAFLISSAALYGIILVFVCTGCPISLASLTLALGALTLGGFVAPKVRQGTPNTTVDYFGQLGALTPLYLIFWTIVGYRLIAHPLSGPDVAFRWSYLAEQMLHFGSLDFYPPRTGADYTRYFWPESIPPGIASLYAWAYACGGNNNALWTSPVIVLQLFSLHEIIGRLGQQFGGKFAARYAILLTAASPLLTWTFLIGQETGQAAVAVCGMVWGLFSLSKVGGSRWAILTGVCAIAATSTREYGPIFSVTAIVAALILKIPRRSILILMLMVVPSAMIWPLRAWALTGNPFYSLSLGGVFPTNVVFSAWIVAFRASHFFDFTSAAECFALGRYCLLWALPSLVGLVVLCGLLFRKTREAAVVALVCLVIFSLWFAYTAYTAGGLFYSLRMLCPALALLNIVAGQQLASFCSLRPKATFFISAAMLLVLLESLPKTLTLPTNPYWVDRRDWLEASDRFSASIQADDRELVARLERLPRQHRLLTDYAGLPRLLTTRSTEVLPIWSPDVAWLFDNQLDGREVAQRWLKSGLHFVVLSKTGVSADFIRSHANWKSPYFTLVTVASTNSQIVLEITARVDPEAQFRF